MLESWETLQLSNSFCVYLELHSLFLLLGLKVESRARQHYSCCPEEYLGVLLFESVEMPLEEQLYAYQV